ncbi:hypothetical protein AUR64_07450 [Haloprofundus marisrubri]|uniref:Uncharacterized protein n=1 Tax=Haloprofundus marisrubri TaxID=1514971 RepID=A0A0W1RC77_9EURY|nr:hypothetical protein [Haloprofundus marisrubri]KTG10993.1 hypothetical protein AUR64_07450 [Haloprofundus marisrubri]
MTVQAQQSEWSYVVVSGTPGTGPVRYELEATDTLEKTAETGGAPVSGASINANDVLDGSFADGVVVGGVDAYRFRGDLTLLSVDGDATVYVDGTQIDPDSVGSSYDYLAVVGDGSKTDYSFEVDGDVAKTKMTGGAPSAFASQQTADSVDAGSVSGTVFGGADAFRIAGDVTEFDLSGGTAYLNGQEYTGPGSSGDGNGSDDGDDGRGQTGNGSEPGMEFLDCTTVEVTGSFDQVSLSVLASDGDCGPGPRFSEQEYVFGLNADEIIEGTTTISLPSGYFGTYQVVESATAEGASSMSVSNSDADACRAEMESQFENC